VNPRGRWFLQIVVQLSSEAFFDLSSAFPYQLSTCQVLAQLSLAQSVVSDDKARFGACIPCTCFIFSGIVAHCRSELVLSTIGCTSRRCTAVNQAVVTVAVVPLYQDWLLLENNLAKTSRRFCDTPTKAGRPRAVSTFSPCRCVTLVQSYSKLRLVQSSYPFFLRPERSCRELPSRISHFLLVPAPERPNRATLCCIPVAGSLSAGSPGLLFSQSRWSIKL